jgi:FtsP/CotA-like multicopper oxidase with cupredoxin domain
MPVSGNDDGTRLAVYRAIYSKPSLQRYQMGAVPSIVLHQGTTEDWTVENRTLQDHVFHIHVNPFLYQRVGPTGKSEWAWKDTLLMPSGATIDTYSQYLDFAGKFVLHCHILDHEDLGMMATVDVRQAGT